ncbi:MAG: DUF308 domain-containing protein [Ruminococcus sp.]|nr:DUF308 domain-containing protein [Ruminococcus sp.]
METLKKLLNSFLLMSIIEIVVGIMLLTKPEIFQTTLSYIIGGIAIAFGALNLIAYFRDDQIYGELFKAIILCTAGIFIIARPDFIFKIIAIIFGLYLLSDGISSLRGAYVMKSNADNGKWIPSFIIALITTLLGVLIIVNPFAASGIPFQLFGISLIISGVLNIYNGGITKRYFTKIQKQIDQDKFIDIE